MATGSFEELKALDYLMRDGEQLAVELRQKINADLRTATELRSELTRLHLGWLFSLRRPAFYRMMSGLEEDQLVESWYEEEQLKEGVVRDKWYRIKDQGIKKVEHETAEALACTNMGWIFT